MGTALITGATSGLGEEFAWQLAAAGHNLVLVARREKELQDIANKIHWIAGVETEVIVADLATHDGLAKVCRRLDVGGPNAEKSDSALGPVGLLVNNAGFALGQSFVTNSLEAEEYALDVMVRAVMILAHHGAQSMVHRGRGAILNVASMAAVTGMGVYGAHKAWVKAFTEALAQDLKGTGVTATEVSPGPIPTNFHQQTGMDYSSTPSWAWTSVEAVASAALAAVRRGSQHVTPGLQYKAATVAVRLAPRALVHKITGMFPHM